MTMKNRKKIGKKLKEKNMGFLKITLKEAHRKNGVHPIIRQSMGVHTDTSIHY